MATIVSNKPIVLVTGGNNGIGLETCRQLARQKDLHVIMASRSDEKGQKAIDTLISEGVEEEYLSLVQLDVTSDESIAAAVKLVTDKHGRLDTLINNAGICPMDVSRDSFRDALEVNCISPAMVTKAFASLLEKSSSPRVIYVTSALGSTTNRYDREHRSFDADYQVYRTSKAALNMVVACDACEYGKKGFKIFAYCPGFVVTDLAGMRQEKLDMKFVPGPEQSAEGILAIHHGKQDDKVGTFIHSKSVLENQPAYPW